LGKTSSIGKSKPAAGREAGRNLKTKGQKQRMYRDAIREAANLVVDRLAEVETLKASNILLRVVYHLHVQYNQEATTL